MGLAVAVKVPAAGSKTSALAVRAVEARVAAGQEDAPVPQRAAVWSLRAFTVGFARDWKVPEAGR